MSECSQGPIAWSYFCAYDASVPPRTTDETVERMRALLHETFERVGHQAAHAQHTRSFAGWFVRHLDSMGSAVSTLAVPADTADALAEDQTLRDVMREVELRIARDPTLLTSVEGRTVLMQNWAQVLLDAAEKVERDRRDEELFAAYGESDEDRAYANSITAVTAENWRKE